MPRQASDEDEEAADIYCYCTVSYTPRERGGCLSGVLGKSNI